MDYYLGEIRPFPYNFAPSGWLFCEGQLLSVADNNALFQILGTTYGGDGVNTFGIPDLRGRVPIGVGNLPFASAGGVEQVGLSIYELPHHNHPLGTAGAASSTSPVGKFPAPAAHGAYGPANGTIASDAVSSAGHGATHENREPFLAIGFAIAIYGIFPTQN